MRARPRRTGTGPLIDTGSESRVNVMCACVCVCIYGLLRCNDTRSAILLSYSPSGEMSLLRVRGEEKKRKGRKTKEERQIRRPSVRFDISRLIKIALRALRGLSVQRVPPIIANTAQECDCASPTSVFTICFGCEKRIKRGEEVYIAHRR